MREQPTRTRFTQLSAGLLVTVLSLAAVTPALMPESSAARSFRLACDDGAGSPLAGLRVRPVRVGGGQAAARTSSSDGVARFSLPEGRWRFKATLLGYRFSSPAFPIPARRRGTLTIPLRPVTAEVRAAHGGEAQPVPGATVFLKKAAEGAMVGAPLVTDEGGRVAFLVPQRPYCFSASFGSSAAVSAPTVWEDRLISLPGGALEVQLLQGEQPLAGLPIELLESPPASPRSATSAADGRARFILPPGEWTVRTMHEDAVFTASATLVAGERKSLVLQCRIGAPPEILPLDVPRQLADGSDLVSLSFVLADGDGDGLRLRLEYAVAGGEWRECSIDPGSLAARDGQVPSLEPGIPFPVGTAVPVETLAGPVTLSLRWQAGRDLLSADDSGTSLRVVASDGHNSATLLLCTALPIDTSPPIPPGAPLVSLSASRTGFSLSPGEPACDRNLAGYLIEAWDAAGCVNGWDEASFPRLAMADAGGSAPLELSGLTRGIEYRFRLVAVDRAGHRSPSPFSNPVSLPSDIQPPAITFESPPAGTVTPDREILVRGTVDDPQAVVWVHDLPVNTDNGRFSLTVPLVDGENLVRARAVDPSGNCGTAEVPVVSIPFEILSPPEGSSVAGPLVEVFARCGRSVATLSAGALTVAAGEGTSSVTIPLRAGANSVTVIATDVQGRSSHRSLSLTGLGGDPLRLEASPSGGIAPVDITLRAVAGVSRPGSRYSWQPEGPGAPGTVESAGDALVHRYTSPGFYTPSVVVTDSAGVVQRASVELTVAPPPRLEVVIPSARPHGVALPVDGSLVVSEERAGRLRFLSPDLSERRTVTEVNAVPLRAPSGLALDEEGRLWLADAGNQRLVAFDEEGNHLGIWAMPAAVAELDVGGGVLAAAAPPAPLLWLFSVGGAAGSPTLTPLATVDLSVPALGGIAALGGVSFAGVRTLLAVDTAVGLLKSWTLRQGNLDSEGPLPWQLRSPSALGRCRAGGSLVVAEAGGGILLADAAGLPGPYLAGDFLASPPSSPRGIAIRQARQGHRIAVADTENDRVLLILIPAQDPLEALGSFRAALLAGDRTAVAAALHPVRRDELLEFLDLLGGRMPEAASWFDRAELTEVRGRTATVRTTRRCVVGVFSGDAAFDVRLLLDDRGEWKVLDF